MLFVFWVCCYCIQVHNYYLPRSLLFFYHRRDRLSYFFLWVILSLRVKLFRCQLYVGSQFHLWALCESSTLRSACWKSLKPLANTVLVLVNFFSWYLGELYFVFWDFKYAFKRLYFMFYPTFPVIVAEFLGYQFCSVVAPGNIFFNI